MDIVEEDLKILEEFIEIDRRIRENKVDSDYEKFCEKRCVAIEHLLQAYKEQEKVIQNLQKEVNEENKKCMILTVNDKFKEQVIDEMAEILSDFEFDRMCENCECCVGNGCNAHEDIDFYKDCIKQYFINKVKENKE